MISINIVINDTAALLRKAHFVKTDIVYLPFVLDIKTKLNRNIFLKKPTIIYHKIAEVLQFLNKNLKINTAFVQKIISAF